jgi:hypothetical protein
MLATGIQKMRGQARSVVAQALVNLKTHVSKLNELLISLYKEKGDHTLGKRNVLTDLANLLPALGMKSFIDLEKNTHRISEEGWAILKSIQSLNCYIWTILETERAAFYKAYYTVFFNELQRHTHHPQIFTVIEMYPLTQTTRTLPIPSHL